MNLTQGVGSFDIGVASTEVSQKVFTASGSSSALAKVDEAVEKVSTLLQKVGALSSRLTVKERTLETAIINTEATRSRIREADFARLQLESIRYIILQQTSMAILAQANLLPISVLSLFRR